MADIVSGLMAFPPDKQVSAKDYDQQARSFLQSLQKLPDTTWSKPVNKQEILSLLDPAVNSLPYLYTLHAQCEQAGKDQTRIESCLNNAILFLATFDPVQLRYLGSLFRLLLEWTLEALSRSDVSDFTPVVAAMLRLDPSGGTFTSTHLRVVRHCLDAGVPSQALPLLDKNIYAFPQKIAKGLPEENLREEQDLSNAFITVESSFSIALRPEFILEYYLLGAHIYIGMRNYTRARLFLEYIILTPSTQHAYSALQLEAYKKWTIVGLLAEGARFSFPRTSDSSVMKSIRAASKAYDALADDFEARDWKKFQAEKDVGSQIWADDGNLRLVEEAADALLRHRVLDLQRTYAAVPVSRVAAHLDFSPDESLRFLSEMIHQGYLNASITPASSGAAADAVLRFHSSEPAGSSPAAQSIDLQAQTRRIQDLITFVRDADRRLQLTKEYVDSQRRQKRSGAGPEGDLADQMDLTWDAPIGGIEEEDGDEDIMA